MCVGQNVDLIAFQTHGSHTPQEYVPDGFEDECRFRVLFVFWHVSDVDNGNSGCLAGVSGAAPILKVFLGEGK